MSIGVLILGESGTGKSTSLRNLNPNETFLIQVLNKPLPFKNSKEYKLFNKETKMGNKIVTDSYTEIISYITKIAKGKKIKQIIIDDVSYLMSIQYMESKETGFNKFNNIGENFYQLVKTIEELERDDLKVFLLGHQQEKETGKTSLKTVGKLIDEKICIEGMFSIVLNTVIDNKGYHFATQNNGNNTTKSPLGMFDEHIIDNDLQFVVTKINEYYGIIDKTESEINKKQIKNKQIKEKENKDV